MLEEDELRWSYEWERMFSFDLLQKWEECMHENWLHLKGIHENYILGCLYRYKQIVYTFKAIYFT